MKINERSKFIINELIKRNTYVTASEIADLLQVSIKTVTRQLVNVEKILNENDLNSLEQLLDTNYLFINYPPSKFENYLNFLEVFLLKIF